MQFESLTVALDAPGNGEKTLGLDLLRNRSLLEEQRANMNSDFSKAYLFIESVLINCDGNERQCTNCGHGGHTAP